MNEYSVLKHSFKVFLCFLGIMGIVSVIMQDISYCGGLVLGYGLSVLIFNLIIYISREILRFKISTAFIVVMFLIKLALYSLGFYLGIKSHYFHILAVFVGYFIIKITIYIDTYLNKGGEEDG